MNKPTLTNRALVLVAGAVLLGGCDKPDPTVTFCDGPTRLIYAPEQGSVGTFPDDYFTVDDPDTRTGLRVSMLPDQDVQVTGAFETHANLLHDISTLDGFGTTAELALIFSGPLDEASLPAPGNGSGRWSASLVLVDLDASPPVFHDIEWQIAAEDDSPGSHKLLVTPVGSLRPKTRYGLALTTQATDPSGACIAPSDTLRKLLSGKASEPRLQRLHGRLDELIDTLVQAGTITGAADLSAAVVFTTQSTYETSAAVAEMIRQRDYPYVPTGDCTDLVDYRECYGSFDADDYRIDLHHIDDRAPSVQRSHTIPVVSYLPPPGVGNAPYPTIIYAHSLTRDRFQAARIAAFACPLGIAVVAIDAVMHGDHPQPSGAQSEIGTLMAFFGMSVAFDPPWDGLQMRDNLRQSAYDKLQLLEVLRPGVDIDGDGQTDVGHESLGFVGASLGGMMGPEFLAFAPEVRFALLIVPGARVGWVIQHGEAFDILVRTLQNNASDSEMARIFPILQTIIDRGDPGSYARHVIHERLAGFDGRVPHLLMQFAVDDEVVPNIASLTLAQGLGIPLLGDALVPIPGVGHEPDLPVTENLLPTSTPVAAVTAGAFQLDVIWVDGGPDLEPGAHATVPDNPITVHQSQHFLSTFLATTIPEILDPYRELGVK